jgi:hypothetical protein
MPFDSEMEMFTFCCRNMISSRTFHEVSICALKVGWKINCYSSEWLVTDMLEKKKHSSLLHSQSFSRTLSLSLSQKLTRLVFLDIFTAIFTCQTLHRWSRLKRTFKEKNAVLQRIKNLVAVQGYSRDYKFLL